MPKSWYPENPEAFYVPIRSNQDDFPGHLRHSMYARPRHRCEGRYKSFMQSFVKVVDLIRADRQSLETLLWERKPSNSVPPWTWYLEHPGTWNLRIPGIVYRISSDVHLSWQVFDEACEVFHALHETQRLQAGSIGEQVTDVCAFEWLEWNGQWKITIYKMLDK